LLDALGIKSGSYPSTLQDSIFGTLDVLPLIANQYCQDFLELTVNANIVGLNSFASGYQVPFGETWLVRSFSIQYTTGAAEQMEARAVAYKSGNTFNTLVRAPSLVSGKLAAGAGQYHSVIEGPFWLTSIDLLAVAINTITTAGTIAITSRANFIRCRR
jgi:hypothetical protein